MNRRLSSTPSKVYFLSSALFFALILFFISCNTVETKTVTQIDVKSKKVITTKNAPQPVGPYSQAILVNGTMYVSGQIGISPSTNQLDTNGFEAEAYQAFRNIINVLEAGDMNADNVVAARVYLTNMEDFIVLNSVFADFFSEKYPARETVEVKSLPREASIEVSVVAVK